METEDSLRDSAVRHRWALVRFAESLLYSEDDAVGDAARDLLDELRTERYPGEFEPFDSLIRRNLRGKSGG